MDFFESEKSKLFGSYMKRKLYKYRKNATSFDAAFFGGDYGTRTCDLMRVKHAL